MSGKANALTEQIITVAHSVPRNVLDSLCEALEALPAQASSPERLRLGQTVQHPGLREIVSEMFRLWLSQYLGLSPTSLAWALRAASQMDDFHRHREHHELVWTGPETKQIQFRRTDQVLLDLIDAAQKSVIVVAFAAYKIPEIVAALKSAVERGVVVTLILESPEESGGKIEMAPLDALGLRGHARCQAYVWPLETRPRDEAGRYGSLHAKCAIGDECWLLISSANLTVYAMNLNMELGLLIRGGDMPVRVAAHFRRLIENGTLRRLF